MAAYVKLFRQKLPGFSDIFLGFLVGGGIAKVYYETSGTHVEDEISSKHKEIQKIVEQNKNLKYGQNLRTIDLSREENDDVVDGKTLFYKYSLPKGPFKHIKYTNHWVCYDQARKIPLWVAEHLTKDKVQGNARRELSKFTTDTNIPAEFQAHNEDFLGTGWSRGHLAPAGDNKHSQDAMNETFFLSNIIPQNLDNNVNFWYRLECYCRSLTKRYSDVYVVSGPVFLPSDEKDGSKIVKYEVIGENQVAVPTHLFKVILAEDKKKPLVLGAFVVPNQPISNDHQLKKFEVTLETLTKNTGISFFSESLRSYACNLCETDGCKLLSKEFMENIAFARKMRNCNSIEELENIWKDVTDREMKPDSFVTGVFKEKKAVFNGTTMKILDY